MNKTQANLAANHKLKAPSASAYEVEAKVVKRDPCAVSAAPSPVWARYIDSRLKQFSMR